MRGMPLRAEPWTRCTALYRRCNTPNKSRNGAALVLMGDFAVHAKVDPMIVIMACPQREGVLRQPVPSNFSPPQPSCVAGIETIRNIP